MYTTPAPVEAVLWLFIIFLGIAFGAALYEQRIVLPLWFENTPAGLVVKGETMRALATGRRFWVFVTTLPLTFFTLASVALVWQVQGLAHEWWLYAVVISLVERLSTFFYFIPSMVKLQAQVPPANAVAMARRWAVLNQLRAFLGFVAWLLAMRALSVLGYPE